MGVLDPLVYLAGLKGGYMYWDGGGCMVSDCGAVECLGVIDGGSVVGLSGIFFSSSWL